MLHRIFFNAAVLCFLLIATDCSGNDNTSDTNTQDYTSSENNQTSETTMQIKIDTITFTATLEDNATAQAFVELLPATWQMNELNGNEKYHYLDVSLPTDASNPGTIHAGDIMLYGSSCIVVFYKTFNTSYSYTRIGHIDDTSKLEQAVGSDDVSMTFSLNTTAINSIKDDSRNDGKYYALNGTQKEHPEKGIYIHNGKKILKQ
ncbi:MAG: cyclophilin-like fold protein [Prevotella sp.]|jgi:hypothetical protein